tara:strand:- start:1422 stop:2243 length:822 start_codon:yes stop_codon:yes gene_type:complete
MNIYSCVDVLNIEKIFVLYYSIYKNTKNYDKLRFYIITDEKPKSKIPEFLRGKLKLGIIKYDNYWNNIIDNFNDNFYKRASWCKSNLNFARFFIFYLFPEVERFIYLDWDMIVQDDIFNLYEYYLKSSLVVANLKNKENIKSNIINEIIIHNNRISYIVQKQFKVNLLDKSFNSGFYIVGKKHFSLKKLNMLINQLINFQSKHGIFKFGTQVIMNLLTNDLEFIDYKWNTNEILENSKIIHWCGKNKPWDSQDEIWLKYYKSLALEQTKVYLK